MKRRRSSSPPPVIPVLSLLLTLVCTAAGKAQGVDASWKELMVEGQHAAVGHDYAKAEQVYQKALKEAERFGTADNRVAATLRSLGSVYKAAKRNGDAAGAFNRAIAILDKGDVEENADFADLNFSLASVFMEQGNASAALPLLERSLSIFSKQSGGESLQVAAVHCMTGDAYRALRNWSEAEKSLKRCAELREADGGVMNDGLGDALYGLALVYEKEGKYGLADPRFKLAEKIREVTQGIMSPGFADVLESHAAMLRSMGRDKEAAQDAALAAAVRRHQPKK